VLLLKLAEGTFPNAIIPPVHNVPHGPPEPVVLMSCIILLVTTTFAAALVGLVIPGTVVFPPPCMPTHHWPQFCICSPFIVILLPPLTVKILMELPAFAPSSTAL